MNSNNTHASSSSASPSPGASPSPSVSSPTTSASQPTTPLSSPKSTPSTPLFQRNRPPLLSSSVSRVEHSVFDLGIRDGSPRLITCVKASQGFDWNLDIFLPSHCDITVPSLSDQIEPVHEIHITEEDQRMLDERYGFS